MGGGIVAIVLIVVGFFTIRGMVIKLKRTLHVGKRALFEARSPDDIEDEEEAIRSAKGMIKQLQKQGVIKDLQKLEAKELKKQAKKTGGSFGGDAAGRFCSNCGNALKQNARFCTNCGQRMG